MTTLVNRNPAEAAKKAADIRIKRCEERREMRTLPCNEVIQRLVHPTPTLASFRLDALLAPTRAEERPIPRFGRGRFDRAITLLRWAGCEWAHPKRRLRQLTLAQRRQLAKALLEVAPAAWKASA